MVTNNIRRMLAIPALAAIAAALPLTISPSGNIEVQDACAQTGTCKYSKPDICVVNGTLIFEHEWINGTGG